jgi:hypothetical protein
VTRLRLIGKEVWGYEKESDDQQLGSCTLRFEVGNSVPSDPITTTVEFEAAGLARVVYTECIGKPFSLRGAYTQLWKVVPWSSTIPPPVGRAVAGVVVVVVVVVKY